MALTHNERFIHLEQRIQMLLDELTEPDPSAAEREYLITQVHGASAALTGRCKLFTEHDGHHANGKPE